jgi:EpsI family protein
MTSGDGSFAARAVVAALLMLGGFTWLAGARRVEPVPAREPLSTLPLRIDSWEGRSAPRFDQQVMTVLGVDDYVNRVYVEPNGAAVGLYVGYYRSQREGDTVHSPLNCLPGAGWTPVSRSPLSIPVASLHAAPSIVVNRFLIEKGLERRLVLYWYQSHGRVIASEYAGKAYLVLDAIRLNRTDGGIVRVIAPVEGEGSDATARAEAIAVRFVQASFAPIARRLPE